MTDQVWRRVNQFSLAEKALISLIIGLRELFRKTTSTVLYHAFKRAFSEEIQRFVEGSLSSHGDVSEVLSRSLDFLRREGFYQEVELKYNHVDRKIVLRIKKPFTFRLKDLAEGLHFELTEQEVSAIGRGMIAGVFSALTGLDVDVDKEIVNERREEATYVLLREVYEKLFK